MFSRISFGMVCSGMAVLQLLSYISGYINPAKAWFMTIVGLLFVPFLLINVFLLVLGIIRHSRSTFIPAVVVLLSLLLAGRFVQIGSGDDPTEDEITLVTYNVGRFAQCEGSDRLQVADEAMAYLASLDPDIVCLQEFFLPNGMDLKGYVARFFPGYTVDYFVTTGRTGKSGNLTISRQPSVARGVLDFKGSANLAVHTDYEFNGKTVRLYNCHFESYNISLSHFVISRREVAETEHKMERAISQRPSQVAEVLGDIDACDLPTIVAGDFNDNPMSYTYNRLVRGRKDAFKAAGKGLGATYRDLWPMLRIDYALYPKEFGVSLYRVDKEARWSDHYPVITKFHI